MTLFLITFLSLYGGLHAYAFVRVRAAFRPAPAAIWLLAAVMVLMIITPLLVRLSEHNGQERLAIALAWPGYIWMGALFLFASALLALDVLRATAWAITRLSGSVYPALITPRLTCEIALALTICATLYSFYEARTIRTEHLTIHSQKIPTAINRIRIVQISDVHLGLLIREERLKRILTQVEAAGPDILVSTGDLVDGRLTREDVLAGQSKLAQMLAGIKAPLGKFAVVGNHEFYAGIEQALAFTRSAGFRVIRGETLALEPSLSISGVDDPAGRSMQQEIAAPAEQDLLRGSDPVRFKILLKHRPLVSPASDGLFDVQLSGHAHQGQLFPFNLLVRLRFPLTGGTLKSAAGSLLHVSRGSGTWGPPLRFLAPPEVTIIDLIPLP